MDLSLVGDLTPSSADDKINTNLTIQLERISISDPSSRTPLFLTLLSEEGAMDVDELFERKYLKC